jgi:hypothetical protein
VVPGHLTVAIAVHSITAVQRTRVDGRVRIVTVAAHLDPSAGWSTEYQRGGLEAEAIAVRIHVPEEVLIHLAIAIVVLAVAQFRVAGRSTIAAVVAERATVEEDGDAVVFEGTVIAGAVAHPLGRCTVAVAVGDLAGGAVTGHEALAAAIRAHAVVDGVRVAVVASGAQRGQVGVRIVAVAGHLHVVGKGCAAELHRGNVSHAIAVHIRVPQEALVHGAIAVVVQSITQFCDRGCRTADEPVDHREGTVLPGVQRGLHKSQLRQRHLVRCDRDAETACAQADRYAAFGVVITRIDQDHVPFMGGAALGDHVVGRSAGDTELARDVENDTALERGVRIVAIAAHLHRTTSSWR